MNKKREGVITKKNIKLKDKRFRNRKKGRIKLEEKKVTLNTNNEQKNEQ